jgi:hypothetical protein
MPMKYREKKDSEEIGSGFKLFLIMFVYFIALLSQTDLEFSDK